MFCRCWLILTSWASVKEPWVNLNDNLCDAPVRQDIYMQSEDLLLAASCILKNRIRVFLKKPLLYKSNILFIFQPHLQWYEQNYIKHNKMEKLNLSLIFKFGWPFHVYWYHWNYFFLYKIFIIIALYCSVVEPRFLIKAEFNFFTLTLPVIKILGANVRDYNRGIIKRSSKYLWIFWNSNNKLRVFFFLLVR